MQQSDFNSELKTQNSKPQPVECLGMQFESDEARRDHFTGLLREKLRDPEFRKIEGFPIGEDEDILNLSDPPYYTACPNPWIGDFIAQYGKPYDPKEKYHREPFAADVSEGKNHPIYNAHSYHTKVPHRAIMRYILHYTEPGDVVFDGFCGTGMTGVAAQLCGDEKEVRELGYRVDADGTIYNEEGKVFSKLGARRAVLNDLSPVATFIASQYNTPLNNNAFEEEFRTIHSDLQAKYSKYYLTEDPDSGESCSINFIVWSDLLLCPTCSHQFTFWEGRIDRAKSKMRKQSICPSCSLESKNSDFESVWETKYDTYLFDTIKEAKQLPVLISYTHGKKTKFKEPSEKDIKNLSIAPRLQDLSLIPTSEIPSGNNTNQPRNSHGLSHVHQFYTSRQLAVFSAYLDQIKNAKCTLALMFVFTSAHQYMNRLCRLHVGNFFTRKGGLVDKPLSGTLYMPSLSVETNPIDRLRLRSRIGRAFLMNKREALIETSSVATGVSSEKENIDYIFVDPPFGANIMYCEVNYLWESWIKAQTEWKDDCVHNEVLGKTFSYYSKSMAKAFIENYQRLKPGRWMTVEFSNTKANVWNQIQTALQEAGFVVANVSAIDKQKGSFKAMTTPTAVKQDLVISAYKPNGGLEKRFAKHGDSVEGVWDFLQTHLKNLPVVKPKGGGLEFIAERDPRILYDRMVAFYVGHNTPVPLSSGEFQAALHEKYPERDGMVFLAEQVAEYDKKAAQMQNVGQLAIFVEDEKSAINWLRQFLKGKPSTYQSIHPEFMQQLSASWKKFETRPELALLLDQNFIKYDGSGDVPSQIHSYLSTDYKDLRKKDKDDPALKAKAKDRWYVPDPKKAVDVEAVRNKRLFAEFWDYAAQAGISKRKPGDPNQGSLPIQEPAKKKTKLKKLKEVRTEAIRYGFLECHRNKDAATILAIAEILPNNVVEEDEQLQMIVDMAEMRAE